MNDGEIHYELVRSQRKTADIVMERDGRIFVRAPKHVSTERVQELVAAKRYWIYKNLAEWRKILAEAGGIDLPPESIKPVIMPSPEIQKFERAREYCVLGVTNTDT